MALDYEKLADKLHEMADIAEVNCQSHPLICGGIRGYPTLKFYSSNGFSKPKSELEYQGNRTQPDMRTYIENNTTDLVYYIDEDLKEDKRNISADEFLKKGEGLPKVIHVKSGFSNASLAMKTLALEFHHIIVFGQITLKKLRGNINFIKIDAEQEDLIVFKDSAFYVIKERKYGVIKRQLLKLGDTDLKSEL